MKHIKEFNQFITEAKGMTSIAHFSITGKYKDIRNTDYAEGFPNTEDYKLGTSYWDSIASKIRKSSKVLGIEKYTDVLVNGGGKGDTYKYDIILTIRNAWDTATTEDMQNLIDEYEKGYKKFAKEVNAKVKLTRNNL